MITIIYKIYCSKSPLFSNNSTDSPLLYGPHMENKAIKRDFLWGAETLGLIVKTLKYLTVFKELMEIMSKELKIPRE